MGITDIGDTLLFLELDSLPSALCIQLDTSGSPAKLGSLSHETGENNEAQEREMTCSGH